MYRTQPKLAEITSFFRLIKCIFSLSLKLYSSFQVKRARETKHRLNRSLLHESLSSSSLTQMSLSKRSTPFQLTPTGSTRDLKQRVIICLNKLSDRDTYTLATTELEQIARSLSHDSFSPFLTCIYNTDPTQKSSVRKQCARLLGFLSKTHGDSLSPHLSKMLSYIVKRLRDSDSAVRSACIEAVAAMSAQITKPPFSVFLKPLSDAILLEQDLNSQIGSALCLASAIVASADPEPAQLSRLLPRLLKLLRSESFKAKPALLSLIGSIVESSVVLSESLLENLVNCMMEFLSSEDWATRKGASEALEKLALAKRNVLLEFKSACLISFEARKFDKVKAVRDAMNRMLEVWKDVPDVSDEVSPLSLSRSCSKENASYGRYPNKKTTVRTFDSPQTNLMRAPTDRQRSPLKSRENKSSSALLRKLDNKKPTTLKFEIGRPHTPPSAEVGDSDLHRKDERASESGDNENNRRQKPETKRALFDNKAHRFGGSRSGSRVVPVHKEEIIESTVLVSNTIEEVYVNQKNSEDLSLIRTQLGQIENQQSSLLDLLQRFMGSSQTGMQSLETRVHGLELALDEICYDLAISTGRMSNADTTRNSCCMIPGADFLSSKFWRRTEGAYSASNCVSSGNPPSLTAMRNITDRDGQGRRFRFQGGSGGLVVNPLADTTGDSREVSVVHMNKMPRETIHGSETNNLRSVRLMRH
ncbi:hypothetical protein GIB67_035714 [Kingdonia uniflora]|uniref:TORTIFOLIA1/SINE1-2 N-terminal domain-containing protein n=1 Tax=Kingdonia uniflora TaxID=39325 RepID=A0A7J7M5Q3_9MAGN|nr:hypothetical protein GIB67_035714 [Kingdonia uniflora]